MVFFTELEQIISQFVWKCKKPQIAKATSRKENRTGGIDLRDFRLYCKAIHKDSMKKKKKKRQYGTGTKTEI